MTSARNNHRSPSLSLRTRLLLAFAVPLLVLMAVTTINVLVLDRTIDSGNELLAGQQVIELVNDFKSEVFAVQIAKRGYALTGDPYYMEGLREAEAALRHKREALTEMTPANSRRAEHLALALKALDRWLEQAVSANIADRTNLPLASVADADLLESRLLALHRIDITEQTRDLENRSREIREHVIRLMRTPALDEEHISALSDAMAGIDQLEGARLAGDAAGITAARHALSGRLQPVLNYITTRDDEIRMSITTAEDRQLIDTIRSALRSYVERERVELSTRQVRLEQAAFVTRLMAWAGPLVALLVLAIVIARLAQRVETSLSSINSASRALAGGLLDTRAEIHGRDEFGILAISFNQMADMIQLRSRETNALAQLGEMLQTAATTDEASTLVANVARELFPGSAGALYLIESGRTLSPLVSWGDDAASMELEFETDECWSLRLGRVHTQIAEQDGRCRHLDASHAGSLCVPLHAFGEFLGVLVLTENRDEPERKAALELRRSFVETVAEQLALALANLRLREELRTQSIRDSLSGLYNRRYLNETLPRELHRAERHGHPIAVLLFDVDHFKSYNDRFGHDAGDAVIRALGEMLQDFFRAEDGAFRYGGEEFCAVLPDTAKSIAMERAEALRQAIEALRVPSQTGAASKVTVSIGVAVYPEDGRTSEQLLKCADIALYEAKRQGRNRVIGSE